ncbi:MAG: RluA family pseudouridine synthase [Fuerstiella sp.]|nr:RluA family pseudouridine synthase [Fuerstiella sp.]
MLQFEFIVEPYLSGVRVDSFLSKHLRNYTRWRLSRMVRTGAVSVNNVTASTDQRVFRSQIVCLRLIEPPDKLLTPSSILLNIVYEDPWLLVVDKPAGLIAHPVGEYQGDTLINALQHHLDLQSPARGLLRPGIIHRLDRMTSGLLVVPKEHMSHRQLAMDFENGRTSKSYVALVEGDPDFDDQRINLPIGQQPGNNSVLMSAKSTAGKPRSARTDVVVRDRCGTHAVIDCELHTGRNHQIRVHLAEVGHPVLGDEFYGPHGMIRKAPRLEGEGPTTKRHALHAAKLGIEHPVLKTWIEFHSKPPSDFWALAE